MVVVVRAIFPFLLSGFMVLACTRSEHMIEAVALRCNYFDEPIGIHTRRPVLLWKLQSQAPGQEQASYRILVSSAKNAIEAHRGEMWDTGKRRGREQQARYGGLALEAGKEYWWKVKVWDAGNNRGVWSAPARFVTGLWEQKDWAGAKWIGHESFPDSLYLVPGLHRADQEHTQHLGTYKPVIPHFRANAVLEEKPVRAVLHVSGLGHYAAYINGNTVNDWGLVPGWTDYSKTVLYNSYDVTDPLRQGDNCLAFTVGNGFHYINRQRYWKLLIAYGFPKLIYSLHVEYENGGRRKFVSGAHCSTASSPITFSSIYGGEDYDARKAHHGWKLLDFDDSHWARATVVAAPGGTLVAEEGYPVSVQEAFFGDLISRPSNGSRLYDFGQNASGIVHLEARAPAGTTMRISPGEVLGHGGQLIQCGGPYELNYTFEGAGTESWFPLFTYYGFRYAQVDFSDPRAELLSLNMLHTRNSAAEVGSFSCSDTLFNKTNDLIRWAMRSNMASIPTDCPHREKLGWLEQCYLVGPSLHYNYDIYHLFRKLVGDMIDSQLDNGLVPDIAPEYVEFEGGFRDSPEWGAAAVMVPWYLYKWYGDKSILRRAYPMMRRYVDYLTGRADDHILDYGLGDWYDLGPKPPGRSQLTPRALTATASFYGITAKLADIAAIIGEDRDISILQSAADSIRDAFNRRFFDVTNATYSTGSQTALAMPLSIGLVPAGYREDVLRTLIRSIEENDHALTAGDIGYRFLVQVLSETGHSEVLYKMNSRSDRPGYGYQIARGATALTESWQALKRPSNNHMMLGHLMEWFYSGLGGVRQADESVGYSSVVIAPVPVEGIDWVRVSYQSVKGTIESGWEKSANGMTMDVRIPMNVDGTIVVPPGYTGRIMSINGHGPRSCPGVKDVIATTDSTAVVVGGGSYTVHLK